MSGMRNLTRGQFVLAAIGFELGLGLLAVLLGWLWGTWPTGTLAVIRGPHLERDLALGLLIAPPLVAGLVLLDRYPVGLWRQLAATVQDHVVPLFRGIGTAGLCGISLAAGLGEELLFRGFLQQALADGWGGRTGAVFGWLLASVLFGLGHSLCAAYAVLATLMGMMLGGLYLATGYLAAPIAAHAAYDFLALLYLTRKENGGSGRETRAAVDLPD